MDQRHGIYSTPQLMLALPPIYPGPVRLLERYHVAQSSIANNPFCLLQSLEIAAVDIARVGRDADLARQRTGLWAYLPSTFPEVIPNGSFDSWALRWLDAHSAIEDSARLCPGNDRAS